MTTLPFPPSGASIDTRASRVVRPVDPVVACAVAAGSVLVFMLWGHHLNHDTSWYFVATEAWLDGAPLYSEIMEINPPLAFYLTAPFVWLSRAMGSTPTTCGCPTIWQGWSHCSADMSSPSAMPSA